MTEKTPTLADVIRTAIDNRLAEAHVMLPGRVERYDAATQKADVTPLIQRLQQGESLSVINETYPVIPNVPIAFPRAGNFAITFPVKAGDTVTLIFCESSIENYQGGSGREPISPEMFQRFDLSDAVAIPGWYPDARALKSTDPDNVVIGDNALSSDFVALAAKVKTEIDAVISDINQLKAVFSGWVTVPNDGGAALKTAAATWYGTNLPNSNSTKAEKVKAT